MSGKLNVLVGIKNLRLNGVLTVMSNLDSRTIEGGEKVPQHKPGLVATHG